MYQISERRLEAGVHKIGDGFGRLQNVPVSGDELHVAGLSCVWFEVDARLAIDLGLLLNLVHSLFEDVLNSRGYGL